MKKAILCIIQCNARPRPKSLKSSPTAFAPPVTGALIEMGIPEIEAKKYEGKLQGGNIIIAVDTGTSEERRGEYSDTSALRGAPSAVVNHVRARRSAAVDRAGV